MFPAWRLAVSVLLVGVYAFALGFPLIDVCPDEAQCAASNDLSASACLLCACCLDRAPADQWSASALTLGSRLLALHVPMDIVPAPPEPQDILHVPKLRFA